MTHWICWKGSEIFGRDFQNNCLLWTMQCSFFHLLLSGLLLFKSIMLKKWSSGRWASELFSTGGRSSQTPRRLHSSLCRETHIQKAEWSCQTASSVLTGQKKNSTTAQRPRRRWRGCTSASGPLPFKHSRRCSIGLDNPESYTTWGGSVTNTSLTFYLFL